MALVYIYCPQIYYFCSQDMHYLYILPSLLLKMYKQPTNSPSQSPTQQPTDSPTQQPTGLCSANPGPGMFVCVYILLFVYLIVCILLWCTSTNNNSSSSSV